MSPSGFWWYIGEDGLCTGPVHVHELIRLFKSGDIDGLTSIHEAERADAGCAPPLDSEDWNDFFDVLELRQAVENTAEEISESEDESDAQATREKSDYQTPPPEDMIAPTTEPIIVPSCAVSDYGTASTIGQDNSVGNNPDNQNGFKREEVRAEKKRKRAIAKARDWAKRTIYVSGIPADANEREVVSFFAKCGILMPDARTGRPSVSFRIGGQPDEGQTRITYAMEPSVENAILLFDGVPLRNVGKPLRIRRALDVFSESAVMDQFHASEEIGPASSNSKRLRHDNYTRRVSDKLKHAPHIILREALGWAEEDQNVGRSLRIVVLRNLFDPKAGNVNYDAIHDDIENGCAECGPVEKVTVFRGNEDGVAVVRFRDGQGARKCLDVMHDRWYDQRRIDAEYYDGISDFRVKETEEQQKERLRSWGKWLSDEDEWSRDDEVAGSVEH